MLRSTFHPGRAVDQATLLLNLQAEYIALPEGVEACEIKNQGQFTAWVIQSKEALVPC